MTKQNYDPDRMTRKVFDRYADKTTRRMERYRDRQLDLERRLKAVEEFLSQGPHAAAWALYRDLAFKGKKG